MENIYWKNNVINKHYSILDELFAEEPSEENYLALQIIESVLYSLEDQKLSPEPLSIKVDRDKSIAENQAAFMQSINTFASLGELVNYKVDRLCKMEIKKKTLYSFVHDFYHSLDREFAKLFDRVFKERKNNLQIIDSGEYPGSESFMYYIKPLDYSYINIALTNTITDYATMVHEYAHAIADQLNYRAQFGKYPFIELLPLFMEELAYDNLINYYEGSYEEAVKADLKALKIMHKFSKGIVLQNKFLSICTNINGRRKFVHQMARYGNKTIAQTQKMLQVPFDEKLSYVIPYLTMIELYHMYQYDPEKSIDTVKRIICSREQEDYKVYLESLGINLNEHTKEFVREKKENNITKYL